jgi:hypothetical protein
MLRMKFTGGAGVFAGFDIKYLLLLIQFKGRR